MTERLPNFGESPWYNIFVPWELVSHNADGTLKAGAVFNTAGGTLLGTMTASGIWNIGSSTFVGSAAAGDQVMSNQSAIWGRNAAGNGLLQMISVTAGDDIVLGQNSVTSDTFIFSGGPGDILLEPGGVVSTNTNGMRIGSNSGGALTEKLVIIGHSSHEPSSGAAAYTRFLGASGGGKNWRIGTGFITSGNFEIQDTSDSAAAYLAIGPTGGTVLGAATGGDKGAGTINAAGAYYANGTVGVAAFGPSAVTSITVKNGLITAIS